MRLTTTVVIALLVLLTGVALAACGSDNGEEATTGQVEREERSGNGAAAEREDDGTAKPDDSAEGRQPAESHSADVKTVVIRNGEPVGGVADLTYSAGEQVRFDIQSDVADEVHIHGYDLSKDVAAGGTVSFSFPAEIEGIFEVELEERVEQIAELRVNP